MKPLDVSPEELATVRAILRAHVSEFEIRVFGSRLSGKPRKTSDLDLVLMTEKPLDFTRKAALRDAFTESDLPFKVDLVDWAAASDAFRRIIENNYEVVQSP